MVSLSLSESRIETTSAFVCSPITDDAVGLVAQSAKACDVIGVEMRVDRLDQLQVELMDELEVAVDPFQHRIDDQRLAALPACQQIRISTRYRIEQLPEDHPHLLRRGTVCGRLSRAAAARC